jgi:diacylglycerol kinase family enzyme
MRCLLIANPAATSTRSRSLDAVDSILRAAVDVDTVTTTHRGHAAELAAQAVRDGVDVVAVLGGDGTVNEAVNGLLGEHPAPPEALPLLAVIPGGHANVFAHVLGLVRDARAAAKQVVDLIDAGTARTVGLGRADDRWFTFGAGLGIDAEVIATVEDLRQRGLGASPATYLAGTVKSWVLTDRWSGSMTVRALGRDGVEHGVEEVVFCIVQNTAPWTLLGDRPLQASPTADLDQGLDLVTLTTLSTPTTLRALAGMLLGSGVPDGPDTAVLPDLDRIEVVSSRPVPLQVDGDLLGDVERVVFTFRPDVLRVVAPGAAPETDGSGPPEPAV